MFRNTGIAFLLAATAALAALPEGARAGAAPEDAAALLHGRGYHHIQIEPDPKPGYRAYACRKEVHFRIVIDAKGNIVDVDPVGECDDEEGPEEVRVQVPFADVKVDKDGVHVRAPFVDLKVPKN